MILNFILKVKFCLFLCLFSNLAWALTATLTPEDPQKNLVEEGNIFNSKLVFEGEIPTENDWADFSKDQFSNSFLFLESKKISDKEYKVRLLLKETPQAGLPVKAFIGSRELELKVTGFHFATVKNPPKDYAIQDQSLGWRRFLKKEYLYTFFTTVLILSYPIFTLCRKIYLKKKLAREKKFKREYWKSYFYSAQTRAEFEEIGKRRQEWLSLLKVPPEECQKFFRVLEDHQYKENIDESELQQIKQALNGMKDVLQRFGI